MTTSSKSHIPLAGQSFRDRDGQRWWVKGPRPGSDEQLVVEAEMKGSYPRVALYVMTEPEFRAHARAKELRPERPGPRESGQR
jgi:hypothetical protein